MNNPSLGKHFFLLFLQANLQSWSHTHEGFFELTLRPSMTLVLEAHIAPGSTERQGHHLGARRVEIGSTVT